MQPNTNSSSLACKKGSVDENRYLSCRLALVVPNFDFGSAVLKFDRTVLIEVTFIPITVKFTAVMLQLMIASMIASIASLTCLTVWHSFF